MRWIATNAGQEGSIVVQKVREMKDDEGFNALTDTYEDLVQGRRHRSREGRALGAAERVVDCVAAAHDRSAHLRDSRRRRTRRRALAGGGGMGGMGTEGHRRAGHAHGTRPGRGVLPGFLIGSINACQEHDF